MFRKYRKRTVLLRSAGSADLKQSVLSLWGPKSLEGVISFELALSIEVEKTTLGRSKRARDDGDEDDGYALFLRALFNDLLVLRGILLGRESNVMTVQVKGLTSKFAIGEGRASTDRQFFYVNGRPCDAAKVIASFLSART